MGVMCSQLLLPPHRLEALHQSGTLPTVEGQYCFTSTVQRHLIELQIQAGHRGGQPPVIYTIELEGLTEFLIQQQTGTTEHVALSIELPDDATLLEALNV